MEAMTSRKQAAKIEHKGQAQERVGHLEDALRETIKRYELVFKATHDILYDMDLTSGRVIWNTELCMQFGYSTEALATSLEWWVSHIHPDDALEVERSLNEWYLSDHSTWQMEYRFRKSNGTYSYVLDRGFITRGPGNEPIRIIGSLLDITKQKELERAKDEFISLVSHQLRTPLTVIRVYGEMFAEGLLGRLTKTQAKQIKRMTDASVRLIQLVNEILDVSRIELGHFDINRSSTNLNRIISQSITQIYPLASQKHIVIQFAPDPSCLLVNIDARVMAQIIDNILANAVRYTRPEIGKVVITCRCRTKHIRFSIKDNGIGIPRSAQKHIFERFYRANNALNIEEHGTGLGLYLVKALTTALGGKVWFESVPDKGTTVYVDIPTD